MQNEEQTGRRLRALRSAADVLQELRAEMPAYVDYIDLAMRRNRMIADRYEQQCRMLEELNAAERKPPQRVNARGRRPPATSPQTRCAAHGLLSCDDCGNPDKGSEE